MNNTPEGCPTERQSSLGQLETWLRTDAPLGSNRDADIRALYCRVNEGEGLLEELRHLSPVSPIQLSQKARIHDSCRELRRRFLAFHSEWLYNVITTNRTVQKSLNEVAFDAARWCPGLVPTPLQIKQECSKRQSDKEGYEIDQGALFSAILRLHHCGLHLVESMLRPTQRAESMLFTFQNEGQVDIGAVQIERRGGAAFITVNNSDCLNAEDNRLVEDMETAVDLALLDKDVRVGIVRGGIMTHRRYAGRRVFSAGINLKALYAGQISFIDFLLKRELGYLNKMRRGLLFKENAGLGGGPSMFGRSIEKPWIAVVDGFAIGGGTQVLLVCDHIIAASDSYLSLPAAQEGIIPGFANLRLSRLIGGRRARQLVLGGRRILANEPEALLLFDEIVDPCDIDAAIERGVTQMSNGATVPNRHMLNLADEPLAAFLEYAAEFSREQAQLLYSPAVLGNVQRFSRKSDVRPRV